MSLAIEDPETEALARRLAALTGKSTEKAIKEALEEKLARAERRTRPRREGERDALAAHLMAIGRECASLPDLDTRTADEIIGYDERGLPR